MFKTRLLIGLLTLALGGGVSLTWAAEPEDLADSLENELLEGLGDDLLDGLDEPAKPETQPDAEPDKEPPPTQPAGEDAGEASSDNPLVRIGNRMRAVESLIAGRQSLKDAPPLQGEIVKDLDALIEQLKKQKNQQQSQSSGQQAQSQRSKVQQPGQQPGQTAGPPRQGPSRDSSERLRPDKQEEVDMAEMQSLLKDLWGHLPDRTREQMLQSSVEQFLPKYEVMIEKYFRRLAEDPQGDERPRERP